MIKDFKRLKLTWRFFGKKKKLVYLCFIMLPIIAIFQALPPHLLKYAIDLGMQKGDYAALSFYSLLFFAAALIEYASRGGLSYLASVAVQAMIASMRMHVIHHLISQSSRFHDKKMSGALVTRATSDFNNLSESLNQGLLSSVVDIFVIISTGIGMYLLSPKLTIYVIGVVPIVILTIYFFSTAVKKSMLSARVHLASANAFFQESLTAREMIKLMSASNYVYRKYKKKVNQFRNKQMESVVYDATLFSIVHGISAITLGFVFWLIAKNQNILQDLSIGVFIAFAQYIRQFFEPIKQLSSKIAMLQGVFTSLQRIEEVLSYKEYIAGDQAITKPVSGITCEKLNFTYDTAPILNDISFHVTHGKSLALVGRTGSGKSTVMRILSKLYDTYSGEIHIDGHNLRELDPSAARKHFGIVSQEVIMFEGSIAFNICGTSARDDEKLNQLALDIGLDRIIHRLPKGWDSKVEYGGKNFSLGERQLFAFARALYKDPQYIILDEATASIDPESEQLIERATKKILQNKTTIVVAHRLNTIKACDHIILLDQGCVVEEGSYRELISKGGKFHHLADHALT